MTTPKSISSDTLLDDVNQNFRVRAGPGAGKTFWLVLQVQNVLKQSKRLTPAARIACISYTNVAVGEIARNLGQAADRVEVSTIHSFLYLNIVKPYLHLLTHPSGHPLVNYALVDGHDEHRPDQQNVRMWLRSVGAEYILTRETERAVFEYLKSLSWQKDPTTSEWNLKPLPLRAKPHKYFPSSKLGSYKQQYWQDGIIDHDDVLYFSYLILERYPVIRGFLSARFPHVFIDEFQDTHPVQTQVVKWLSQAGSTVGVIGDPEQSIYGFNGAQPSDFNDLSDVAGLVDYVIADNRRSTERITNLLNKFRGDGVTQAPLRREEGHPVSVYSASALDAVSIARKDLLSDGRLFTLARTNAEVATIRRGVNSTMSFDPWDSLATIDPKRYRFLESVAKGHALSALGRLQEAERTVRRCIKSRTGKLREPLQYSRDHGDVDADQVAVAILLLVADQRADSLKQPVLEVYARFSNLLSQYRAGLSLTSVRDGAFARFASTTLFIDLLNTTKIIEDQREMRTIHQAKGAEFDNVLIALSDEKHLDYILIPDAKRSAAQSEEKRILYVGMSRARNRLFISVPSLSPTREEMLRTLGVEVTRSSSA